jgi:hypothetical protein
MVCSLETLKDLKLLGIERSGLQGLCVVVWGSRVCVACLSVLERAGRSLGVGFASGYGDFYCRIRTFSEKDIQVMVARTRDLVRAQQLISGDLNHICRGVSSTRAFGYRGLSGNLPRMPFFDNFI